MFFDPISRTPQAVLLLSFCVLGTLGLLKKLNEQRPAWLSILRGAGLVVAGYWSLLLLPVLVIGFLGYGLCIVYTIGIGLLAIPLFLICMATAAAPLYLFYRFLRSTNLERHRGPWLIGMLLGLGLLLIVEGPSYVTRLQKRIRVLFVNWVQKRRFSRCVTRDGWEKNSSPTPQDLFQVWEVARCFG